MLLDEALVQIHPSANAGRPVSVLGNDAMTEEAERFARPLKLDLDLSAFVRREAAAILRTPRPTISRPTVVLLDEGYSPLCPSARRGS